LIALISWVLFVLDRTYCLYVVIKPTVTLMFLAGIWQIN